MFYFYAKQVKKKCLLKVPKKKKAFLDEKKIGSKNNQNLHFFKGVSPWFLSKNGDFLIFSFYAKGIKKQFSAKVWKEKKIFWTIKYRLKKQRKLVFFQRGQSMVFVKKWRFFNLQFLCKRDQEVVFCEGLEGKKDFLDHKISTQKTTKIGIFSKGLVHGFCQKMEIF